MQTEELDALKQRYDFDAWKGINRLDRELSVRKLALPKGPIAGLDPARVREIDPGDGSRLLRTSWLAAGKEGALLVMDIRECESREAAHGVLLELLGNMQAPDVKRLEDSDIGDVAFARDPANAVIFARGNVALSIRNGGETLVPVGELAAAIDNWIIEQGR